MVVLRIEHKVQNYDGWKNVFDSDPINRKKSGVRNYKIYRPTNDQNYVIIDLEFENTENAESTLEALHKVWGNMNGKIIFNPQTRILDLIENINVI